MKRRYQLYRRNGTFYLWDNTTGKRESLQTRDADEAEQILTAKNQAQRHSAVSLQIAKAYLSGSDPLMLSRTWQHVMEEAAKTKCGSTRDRWMRAMKEAPFELIRNLKLIDTRAEQFIAVLERGTASSNMFLRRLHNFALDMDWLPKAILPRRQWPAVKFEEKRAITFEEYQKILAGESSAEWKAYYQLLWHLGGSQTDIANLTAEDVDGLQRTISFKRHSCRTTTSPRGFVVSLEAFEWRLGRLLSRTGQGKRRSSCGRPPGDIFVCRRWLRRSQDRNETEIPHYDLSSRRKELFRGAYTRGLPREFAMTDLRTVKTNEKLWRIAVRPVVAPGLLSRGAPPREIFSLANF
jgi:hypothetical protein